MARAKASKAAALGNQTHIVQYSVDWQQFATDGGALVMVLDPDGRVLFINGAAAKVFGKRAAREATGVRLADLLPAPAAAERVEIGRQVAQTGEAVVFNDLWAGVAFRATVRRLDLPGGQGHASMWTFAQETSLLEESSEKSTLRVISAKHTDLGSLAGLTASELKVLALIGEGLSNADIAARLHRAVKTIESHRAALTEKTGSSSRVQLGVMARRAGLAKRISLNDTRASSVTA